MSQDVGQPRERACNRRTEFVAGVLTKRPGNLCGGLLGAAASQLVDRSINPAVAHGGDLERPKSIGENADEVGGYSLHVPAPTETWRRQLSLVEPVDQNGDSPPLVGHRRKNALAVKGHTSSPLLAATAPNVELLCDFSVFQPNNSTFGGD